MATALDKYADAEPHWDYPVVIESHINGVRSKEMNPNTRLGTTRSPRTRSGAGGRRRRDPRPQTRVSTCWRERVQGLHADVGEGAGQAPGHHLVSHHLQQPAADRRRARLEHVALLNEHAHAEIACVDTGLTLFATHTDDEGYLVGPEFGFNYARSAAVADAARAGRAMVYGVYEPGHLRHAMYYVNQACPRPARCGTSTSSVTTA